MSFYIGKLKVRFDRRPAYYQFGMTVYYPKAKMVDFCFGKHVLTLWYRA